MICVRIYLFRLGLIDILNLSEIEKSSINIHRDVEKEMRAELRTDFSKSNKTNFYALLQCPMAKNYLVYFYILTLVI